MNWLLIGLPLALSALAWMVYLIIRKKYTRPLLLLALFHLPYMLVNVVAPFRGVLDPQYHGYNFGWLQVSPGILVTLVAGSMGLGSLLIATRALKNKMKGFWVFTMVFDFLLTLFVAIPVFYDVVSNPAASTIELGEYMKISGIWVAMVILMLFTIPTTWSFVYALRQCIRLQQPKKIKPCTTKRPAITGA